jgi:EmrB/QacA subfamily drug resistance transporter
MTIPSVIDYRKKWFVMAAVGMGVFLSTIDGSIVNIALPTLVESFKTTFAVVEWVVLAYLLTMTTLMLGVGRLADILGKKSIYAWGFVIFTIGSFLSGLSPTIYALISSRVLQGIGAAMVISLSMAIITEAFPPGERGLGVGVIGTITSIGIVVGPALGGILISSLSWHWIFFVNLPVGIIGILLVILFVPSLKPSKGQHFDFLGGLTLFGSLMFFLFALTYGQDHRFSDPAVFLFFGLSIILTILFIYVELHSKEPMLDLRLFRNELFSSSLLTGMLTFIAISGTVLLLPFYLEDVLNFDASQVGLLLGVVPLIMGLVAPLSGILSDRFGTRPIAVIGLFILLAGYVAMTTLSVSTNAIGFELRFLPVGLGMGVFQSPNNSAIMGTSPKERLGVVSGMLAISRTFGQTIGIATLGSVWAERIDYHAGQILPGGVVSAPATIQVAALQDTFIAIIVLIGFACILGLWGLRRASRQPSMEIANPTG